MTVQEVLCWCRCRGPDRSSWSQYYFWRPFLKERSRENYTEPRRISRLSLQDSASHGFDRRVTVTGFKVTVHLDTPSQCRRDRRMQPESRTLWPWPNHQCPVPVPHGSLLQYSDYSNRSWLNHRVTNCHESESVTVRSVQDSSETTALDQCHSFNILVSGNVLLTQSL